MNVEESKQRVAAQNDHLRELEAAFLQLAADHPAPVLGATLRVLIEMVAGARGANFVVHNKITLYTGILELLRTRGVVPK